MQDIEALRENLFSGTCVMESRRSVEQTRITIEQNRSIMLLTLVTIFFLPLTFVTSIFGMTNMNPAESFQHFAWVVLAVCIPTYLLIGSLHTDTGLNFWSHNKNAFFARLGGWLARFLFLFGGYVPRWAEGYQRRREEHALELRKVHSRSPSVTRAAMKMRQTAGDGPSISRNNTREGASVPRPHLTSGDAAAAVRRSTMDIDATDPPRSPEIAFSRPRPAVTTREKALSSSVESISPRDGSLDTLPEKLRRRETDLEEIRQRTRDHESDSIRLSSPERGPTLFGLGLAFSRLWGRRGGRAATRQPQPGV